LPTYQLTDGRRFRILTVVDDCTRECLALVADTSLSGVRVARELDRLMGDRGKPTVTPARISLTGRPLVRASRSPTSKLRLSRTCQMRPTKADTVLNWPNACSAKNSATGRTDHFDGPSIMAPRNRARLSVLQ
jgi:hypothetical protein